MLGGAEGPQVPTLAVWGGQTQDPPWWKLEALVFSPWLQNMWQAYNKGLAEAWAT